MVMTFIIVYLLGVITPFAAIVFAFWRKQRAADREEFVQLKGAPRWFK